MPLKKPEEMIVFTGAKMSRSNPFDEEEVVINDTEFLGRFVLRKTPRGEILIPIKDIVGGQKKEQKRIRQEKKKRHRTG